MSDEPTVNEPVVRVSAQGAPTDVPAGTAPTMEQPARRLPTKAEQQRTLWVTAWGVVLAASAAFSLGYGASRRADPSVGASRPPAWPLIISLLVVLVSIWFVLAPRLRKWPFAEVPAADTPTGPDENTNATEPWLAELSDAEDH
jgi:hypothetical protein